MPQYFKTFSIPLLLSMLVLSSAGCKEEVTGWRGTLDVRQRGRNVAIAEGQVYGRPDGAMFFSLKFKGHEMGVIDDPERPEPIMLLHALRAYAKAGANEIENGTLFSCRSGKVEECLNRKRFRKVAEEVTEGHLCDVYVGASIFQGKEAIVKVWHPKDFPQVHWVRAEAQMSGGIVVDGKLTQVQTAKLEPALFSVPADYKVFDKDKAIPGH